jgi:hypothetical protein
MARTDEYYDLMEEKRRKAREDDKAAEEGKTATLKKYEGKSPPSADMRQFEPTSNKLKMSKYEGKPLPAADMRPREPISEAVRTKDAMNRDKLNAAKAAPKK